MEAVKRIISRVQLVLIGVSLLAAVLLHLLLSSKASQAFEKEQERLALLWNGYAKMYYEQAGDWSGFAAQFRKDRYMLGSDTDKAIYVYDRNGSAALAFPGSASGLSASDFPQTGRKIPILVQGETVGYTLVRIAPPANTYPIVYGIPSLLALIIYGAGILHLYRVRRAEASSRSAIAAELLQRISGERGASLLAADDRKLAELALQEVDKLADKVERLETVRRTMVADIAHELRTPIAIMRTQLDNALHDGGPLPLPKIAALHDETIRLTKLVRDLQELSLAETGNLPLDKGWFSLTGLVQSVSEALSVDAEERKLALTVNVSGRPDIRIYADETRVRQILINLIGNGLQHARTALRIETRLVGSTAEVTVADDGWGIEEEELSRVFDRFYRGQNGSRPKTRTSGLGLGLAIAYQFALAHQGGIALSSRWGEGAEFTLKLPVIDG